MVNSLHAWVAYRGTIIRWDVAHVETVVRALAGAPCLDDYLICYEQHGRPHLVSAERFLEIYESWRSRESAVCA